MNNPKEICSKCGKAGIRTICINGAHWIFTCRNCNFKHHCKCNDKA